MPEMPNAKRSEYQVSGMQNVNCLIDFYVLFDTLCMVAQWGHPSSVDETAFCLRTQKKFFLQEIVSCTQK